VNDGFFCCAQALRRVSIRLGLFLSFAFTVLLPALAQAADLVPMKPVQVTPSAWYVEGVSALGSSANQNFISNAGFVVTPEGVVVIDALGSPALAERLMAEIAKITPQPVKWVIVTHYHADHIYGLQAFQKAGARILAHRAAREYLNSETARLRLEASRQDLAPWIDENTRLVPPDEWVDDERRLRLGGVDFVIKHLGPAHTPEDLAVYVPSERLLFAGDLVFRSRIPFVGQADSGHWIQALDVLLGFDATVVVPGHGPLSAEPRKDMQLTRDYLAYLRKTMGEAARNLEPFESAYEATDWSAFEALPLFKVANRMNAYNTYLLMERESK
jgi:glyoxylase-like metal-dependent hydrolase (beta-lactamase superfamily II)